MSYSLYQLHNKAELFRLMTNNKFNLIKNKLDLIFLQDCKNKIKKQTNNAKKMVIKSKEATADNKK